MAEPSLRCEVCAVRHLAACASLSETDRRELARMGHRRTLSRGEHLSAAGSENSYSATLVSGLLKVSAVDAHGTEHLLSLIHPAGFAGELFTTSAEHDVVALVDSELCLFPRRSFEAALERFPRLSQAMLRRSASALSESRALLASVTSRSAVQKVAGLILDLSRAANVVESHPATEFDLILSRGDMAALLGLTIETVSRKLTQFEREGFIERTGARGIRVLDAARLASVAN